MHKFLDVANAPSHTFRRGISHIPILPCIKKDFPQHSEQPGPEEIIVTPQHDINLILFHDAVRQTIGNKRKTNGDDDALVMWKSYLEEADPLLEKFFSSGDPKSRLHIVYSYLFVLNKYIRLNINGARCFECHIDNMAYDFDAGGYICECGIFHEDLIPMEAKGSKSSYSDIQNFEARLKAFQSQRGSEIPSTLICSLEKHFSSKKIDCQKIRDMPCLDNGKKAGTNINMLIEALHMTKNNKYYWAVDGIATELWSWRPHNLSLVIDKIMADYISTQENYVVIRERHSSLNINLRLYWHLRIVGHPCEISDFRIPITSASIVYNCKMFERMCEMSGIKYPGIY